MKECSTFERLFERIKYHDKEISDEEWISLFKEAQGMEAEERKRFFSTVVGKVLAQMACMVDYKKHSNE